MTLEIVKKPEGIESLVRGKHKWDNLADMLKGLGTTKAIKTNLKELGFQKLQNAKWSLKATMTKRGMKIKVVEKDHDIYIFI